MRENNDSFFNKILLKNIDEEIPIDIILIYTSAKNSPSNSLSAQTKQRELLRSLKNQISSLKSEVTFLREELKEKDYVVKTLLNMKCKSLTIVLLHHAKYSHWQNLPEKTELE